MNEWIGRIRTAFAGLAPRERLLVSSAGGMLLLALGWVAVVNPILGAVERRGLRRETAEQELRVMTRLAREYEAVQSQLGDVEESIRSSARGNLRTTLESLALDADIKVESMEPQASPANESYRETKVEVGLKSVDLESTVKYLHEIEASPQMLSVKSLRIRARTDKSSLLDVTFTVSSFEPVESRVSDAPAEGRPLPRPLRITAIAAAALLLTSTFVYLGFPYDRLAFVAAERLQGSTGYRISYGPVGASPGLLGPGMAVEDLRATAPDGESFDFSRVRVRPAWSPAWLTATPALFVDARADFGHLRGVTRVSSTPRFDGELRGVDLTALLAQSLPRGARLTGKADIVADVTLAPEGAQGPVRFEVREGTLSHPRLPMDVPYEQIDGVLVLGGELTAEVVSIEIRSPLGTGNVSVGRAADIDRAPLDLSIEIIANEGIQGVLRSQGVRFGSDGRLSLQLTGTLARPRFASR